MGWRLRRLKSRRRSDAAVRHMDEDRDRLRSLVCIGITVFLSIAVFAVVLLLLPRLP